MNILIHSYIQHFRILHNGDPWLDETFEKKLKAINEEEAFARPHGLLSVAEEVWHLIAWRENVMQRLEGRIVPFDEVINWMSVDNLKEMGWDALWKRFVNSHIELVDWLAGKKDVFLENEYPPTGYDYQYYLDGLVHHDAYHMGQIGIVLKLVRG